MTWVSDLVVVERTAASDAYRMGDTEVPAYDENGHLMRVVYYDAAGTLHSEDVGAGRWGELRWYMCEAEGAEQERMWREAGNHMRRCKDAREDAVERAGGVWWNEAERWARAYGDRWWWWMGRMRYRKIVSKEKMINKHRKAREESVKVWTAFYDGGESELCQAEGDADGETVEKAGKGEGKEKKSMKENRPETVETVGETSAVAGIMTRGKRRRKDTEEEDVAEEKLDKRRRVQIE